MQTHTRSAAGAARKVAAAAPLWVLGFSILLFAGAQSVGGHNGGRASAAAIVPETDEPLVQYRALRRMHVRSDRFNQEGWMEAWTELDEYGFRYRIVSERGSEYVRRKVLRAVLEREQEIGADGAARAALTDANYTFSAPAEYADGTRYVLLKPKRKDVVLVDGRAVLTSDGSELLRVEGRLAKNPSFWTTRVDIVRRFSSLSGVRVPVATECIAKVRFAGESRLEVQYEYESVNHRPVSALAAR